MNSVFRKHVEIIYNFYEKSNSIPDWLTNDINYSIASISQISHYLPIKQILWAHFLQQYFLQSYRGTGFWISPMDHAEVHISCESVYKIRNCMRNVFDLLELAGELV